MKEEKKMILLDEALMAWKIVLREEHYWPLLNDFIAYLQVSLQAKENGNF
jgi:hypothetical protein